MPDQDTPADPAAGGTPAGGGRQDGRGAGLGPGLGSRPPWDTAGFPVSPSGLPVRPVKPRPASTQAPWGEAELPADGAAPAAAPRPGARPSWRAGGLSVTRADPGGPGSPTHPPWETAEFPAAALPVRAGRQAVAGPEAGGASDRHARQRAGWAAWLIALVTFAAYATISVYRYLRLQPGSWDLGIYTEYVRQIAHLHMPVVPIRSPGFNLLGDHFQPVVALLAPFFRVFPSPLTLLIAQALLTAVSVVPVVRAARVLTGLGVSLAIGAAYGFSWGLQQMVNFDFHEIAFAVPLLAFSLSALVCGRLRAAVLWALPLVLVKEDQGFTVAVIGLIVLGAALGLPGHGLRHRAEGAGRRRTWALAGGLLIVWGLAWSAAEILVIIPHFNVAHHYQYWQDGGVISLHGRHFSVPGALGQLRHASGEKLKTLLMIGLPVAFLALGSPLALAAAPSLLLRFLSTNSYYWGTDWHYNATLMPIVFLAAVDTLARLRGQAAQPSPAAPAVPVRRPAAARAAAATWVARLGAAAMLGIAGWLAVRQPVAGLWQPQTYAITAHVRAEQAAMAKVPPGTTVETTLSMLAPLAARDDTSWVGTVGLRYPQYLVFDATNSGWSPLPVSPPLRFLEERHPGAVYQQIFEASGVYVFRLAGVTAQ